MREYAVMFRRVMQMAVVLRERERRGRGRDEGEGEVGDEGEDQSGGTTI